MRRYDPDDPRFTGWSDDALLSALEDAAEQLGTGFTRREYDSLDRIPGSQPMVDRFGSWPAAKDAAFGTD